MRCLLKHSGVWQKWKMRWRWRALERSLQILRHKHMKAYEEWREGRND